jgi:xylulokinase
MSNKEKYILAYDHGTSGMKTAIISTKGEIVGFSVEEYKLSFPEQGAVEQDQDDWWAALVKTTHDLLGQKLVAVEDIIAVVQSNQMSGTIPIDKEGNSLSRCFTWMDTRGAPQIKKLVGGLIEISGYGITNILKWIPITGGAPTHGGKDCIGHILYIKDKLPEIYEKTWKFLDCKDYLHYKMTGETVSPPDCAFLLWIVNSKDPYNYAYDPILVEKTGLDVEKLPELKPATYTSKILPEIAKELKLSPETKVVLGSGDMCSAAVGSGAVSDCQAHICIGSSSWVMTHYNKRKVDIFHMIASLPCSIPGKYITFGEQESAGVNLTWLRDNLLYHKDELLKDEEVPDVYKIFDKLVEEVEPGAKNLIFTPWMFGERCPIEDHTVRAGFYNLSLEIDRRHLIRAIFEGVAFNSKWVLKYSEKLVGKRLDPITLVGGGAMSDVWCQIYADILDRTIIQAAHPKESNSLGAAYIALVSLDYISWDDIPGLVKSKQEFKPRPEYRKMYDNLFKEFTGIYANNRKMYNRLNRFDH